MHGGRQLVMTPWRWLRYRWYVWTKRVHPAARIDHHKRVYAISETKYSTDEQYWAWVRTAMPHAMTLDDLPDGETFEQMYRWLSENTTTLWSMRQSMFRAMNSGAWMSLPLKNVYYFANEDDAFAFRLRFGATVGEDVNAMKAA
jgi:hypothetical protein